MRLPGLDTIIDSVGKVVRRFPFAMLIALIGTASAYAVVHFKSLEDEWSLYRLLMSAVLGFLLLVVIQLKLEREKIKGDSTFLVKLIGVIFLALYYWQLPNDFDFASADFIIRFFLLGLALLFSATFIPFIRHVREVNGFWQYCKILFVRLFLTFIFTGTLYLGLVLALVGVKELLGVDFDEKIFLEMWIVIVGLVSTSFFLAGVPEKTAGLQKKTDYHSGIRIFAEYVLTPLILIYALILYVYTGKIILRWDWPEGTVSWLIIVFSVVTVLANFMLYPLMKKETYVKYFQKISYALIIPLTVVMFLALRIRIDEYGLTESRYYGMVLCFWFLLVSLYFIFSKKKNLLVLPVSLFIITLVSSAGPLSSMNVSKWSQMGRLEAVLTENGILVDGKVKKTDKELSKKDVEVISGALDYIERVHSFEVVQPWFEEDLGNLNTENCWGTECVMDLMGVDYIASWERRPVKPQSDYRNFRVDESEPMNVEGYRRITLFHLNSWGNTDLKSAGRLSLSENPVLLSYRPEEGEGRIMFPLEPLLNELLRSGTETKSWEDMKIRQGEVGIGFKNISLQLEEGGKVKDVLFLDGYLLTK
jgi:hypothetical protein